MGVFRKDGSLYILGEKVPVENPFLEKSIQIMESENKISLKYPDRHHLMVLQYNTDHLNKIVTANVNLRFKKDSRLYVLFFTTEPTSNNQA